MPKNNSANARAHEKSVAKYSSAILLHQSLPDVATALGLTVGTVREWCKRNWNALPPDAQPQWLIDSLKPRPAKETGAAGGRKRGKAKKRYANPVARSKVRSGALAELSAIKSMETMGRAKPARVSLPMPPAFLVIEGADQWGLAD